MKRPARPNLFISYSHADEAWKDRVVPHIQVAFSNGLKEPRVELWDDRRILVGDRWRTEIEAALERADAAILLVSVDFWPRISSARSKSVACWNVENRTVYACCHCLYARARGVRSTGSSSFKCARATRFLSRRRGPETRNWLPLLRRSLVSLLTMVARD